jgi:type 1 fimbria pilin
MSRRIDRRIYLGKSLAFLVGALVSLFMTEPAMATCSESSQDSGRITMPASLAVPRNVAPGQILWDSNWLAKSGSPVICNSAADTRSYTFGSAKVSVPGFDAVYESGIPGVGIKSAVALGASQPADINAANLMRYPAVPEVAGAGSFDAVGSVRVQLIATGPVSAGTSNLPSAFGGQLYNGATRGIVLQLANARFTVTAKACTVQNSALAVPVPKAKVYDFGAVGSTAGEATFSLSLDCPAAIAAAITFTDAFNPGNRTANLTLSPDSSAAGLAYQIEQESRIIAYGPDSADAGTVNQIPLNALNAPGVTVVPFKVHYVKTGLITPGSANAKATFTLSYQ